MECLKDLIGLRGCSVGNDSAMLFVDDFDGISRVNLNAATSQERATILDVWNACWTRASGRFNIELIAIMQKSYQLKTIAKSFDLLRRIDQTALTAPAAKRRGFTIETTPRASWWVASNYQVIYLSDFSLHLTAVPTSPVIVKAYDLETETELDSFTIQEPQVGWNTVRVEKSFDAWRFALMYDATVITSTYMKVPDSVPDNINAMIGLIYGNDCSVLVRGAETADLNRIDQYGSTDNTFGLTARFSFQCRYDRVVCQNRNMFVHAAGYLMAAELLHSILHSDKLHRFNTIDEEDAKELISQYYGEFSEALKTTCSGIRLDTSDACIECNASVQFVESRP
jgi:hypothetical protein